jgi:hypothetical protein
VSWQQELSIGEEGAGIGSLIVCTASPTPVMTLPQAAGEV